MKILTSRNGLIALPLLASLIALNVMVGEAHAQVDTKANTANVVIGSGAPMGVYFAVGNALCRLVERAPDPEKNEALRCSASATGGSRTNVEALRTGAIHFALVQSDVAHNAVRGSGRFEGRKMEKLRTLFSLHVEPFQLLVLPGLGVGGFADAVSRKINLGPKGSAQHDVVTGLLRLHGANEGLIAQLPTLPPATQSQALCDGDIEAAGMLIGYPNAGFSAAMSKCGAQLLDVDTAQVRKFVAERSFYTNTKIPKGAYPSLTRDVNTFGVMALLTTTDDVSADSVYALVRATFERLDSLKAMHPALSRLEANRMIRDGIVAPLHEGAIRYYRERGWM
jgi:uncharacterized protein